MGKITSITSTLLLILFTLEVASAGVLNVKPEEDITQALLTAWKEACAAPAASTITIPKGNFILGQVLLEGPCKGSIELQVQGIVKAPADPSKFQAEKEWITISRVDHLTMNGGGTFDGQGSIAWKQNDCAKTGKCSKLPTNLSLSFLTDSKIQDLTSKDSKLFHVNVLGCKNLTFDHFNVLAPGDSPNSDGIHIGRSNGVSILDANIKTGDDCVSIGDGSQQITVERVTCGPGHGIAVGSLGKYDNEEPVVGIFVRNCTISDTMNGVRVKTWPNSPKAMEASDLHFENIIMNNVGTPVLIDQEYCPYNQCTKSVASKVKISKVSFKDIRGTSSSQVAVKIVCSQSLPCEGVEVGNIDLTYSGKEGPAFSECKHVTPTFVGKQNPPTCGKAAA